MVVLKKITDADDVDFKELLKLYIEAFPEEERRDILQLEKMLSEESRMRFNAVMSDNVLAGLFVYWDFGTFYYLEHLAVYSEMRNHEIGRHVLDWIRENLPGLRLLEAERAETEMATRRIRYYERNGYIVLDKEYMQPSYRPEGEPYPLWLMGNQEDKELDAKVNILKEAVYYRGRKK